MHPLLRCKSGINFTQQANKKLDTNVTKKLDQNKQIQQAKKVKRRKRKMAVESELCAVDFQDDCFCFIAGYTSGGVPYGLTWEEVGIDSELPFEEKVYLYQEME